MKMFKMKVNLIFKLLIRIGCLIGCVYQSLRISELYFSYETITNVKYETHNTIHLSGINICYNKKLQVIDEYKDLVYKNIRNKIDAFKNFNNNYTIRDQFSLFYEKPRAFIACSISPNHLAIDCLSIDNLTQSVGRIVYCFKLFEQSMGVSDEKYVIREETNDKRIIIFLNKTVLNVPGEYDPIMLKIIDRKRIDYQFFTEDQLILDLKKNDYCFAKYRKFVVNYLFVPKGRPCFVGQTKEECEDLCSINQIIEKTGEHPYLFQSWNISSDLKIDNSMSYNKLDLVGLCAGQCSGYTECYKEYYISEAEQHTFGNKAFGEEYHLMINFPTHPTTIYEISLKMCFEEYLCLIKTG